MVRIFNDSEIPQYMSERDGGEARLTAGLRFRVTRPCTVVAVRYLKAKEETGVHQAFLYGADGMLLATSDEFRDDWCVGPKWVQVPLQKPWDVSPQCQYTVAIDGLSYYTSSEGYRFDEKKGDTIVPIGGFYSWKAGLMPTTGPGTDNYWVDGKRPYSIHERLAAPCRSSS
jgi:hypothetical protein